MAFHNVNYEIVPLTGGTYNMSQLGDGLSAATVHEIYCLTSGTIQITALGGGTATFALTANQSVKVLAVGVTITSGTYVGFRAKNQFGGIAPTQW